MKASIPKYGSRFRYKKTEDWEHVLNCIKRNDVIEKNHRTQLSVGTWTWQVAHIHDGIPWTDTSVFNYVVCPLTEVLTNETMIHL